MNKKPILYFDISVLGIGFLDPKARTGVHRFTHGILREILHQNQEFDVVFFSCGRGKWVEFTCAEFLNNSAMNITFLHRESALPWSFLQKISQILIVAIKKKSLSESPILFFLLKILGELLSKHKFVPHSIIYSPSHALPKTSPHIKRVITLHDLFPLTHPMWFKETKSFKHIIDSIKSTDQIITVSEYTASKVKELLQHDLSKLCAIHLGVDEEFKNITISEQNLKQWKLKPNEFILSVGTLEPRKNLKNLIKSYSVLSDELKQRIPLVIIGANGWLMDDLDSCIAPEDKNRIILTGFISDEALKSLYSYAKLFVYPSLAEGFGIPIIEAMYCHTPILSTNHTALHEILPQEKYVLDPCDPCQMANIIEEILSSPEKLNYLKESSISKSRFYTWDKTAKQYLEVFKECLNHGN